MGVLDTAQPLTNQAAVAPPVGATTTTPDGAAPGWWASTAANFRNDANYTLNAQQQTMGASYDALADQVAAARGGNASKWDYIPQSSAISQALAASQSPGMASYNPEFYDKTKLWSDFARIKASNPKFMPGIANQAEFEEQARTHGGQYQHDAATGAAGGWTSQLAGGAPAMLANPAMVGAMAMGGPELPWVANTILTRALSGVVSRALTNTVIGAAAEPETLAAQSQMGVKPTIGGAAADIAGQVVGGEVLHPVGMAIGKVAAPVLAPVVDALGYVASRFADAIPPIFRTPDEQAALHVITRNSDVEGANPFPNSSAAMDLHKQRLSETMLDMDSGAAPGSSPSFAPPPREPAPASTLTPDAIISFVQGPLEGGAKTVHYGTGDGGLTRFGIAAVDNPGVDVANLSAEQAHAIAKSKYWFPELDQQSPAMQAIGFDAGYISGPDYGRELIAEAGGDPAKALELYRAHLNEIADTVAGKAQYRKGWNARVDKLGAFIDEHGGGTVAGAAPGEAADTAAADEGDEGDQAPQASAGGAGAFSAPDEGAEAPSASERPQAAPEPVSEVAQPLSVQVVMPGLRALVRDPSVSLNRIDDLAGALDAHPDDVRAGLQQLVANGELRQRSDTGAFMRAAPGRDLSLIESIQKNGGIWDGGDPNSSFKGGDYAAMGLDDWYKGGPFRSKAPIIRSAEMGHGDRGPDKVLQRAIEDGYFPELRGAHDAGGPSSLDTNHLNTAIAEELAGRPRYPVGSRSFERQGRGTGADIGRSMGGGGAPVLATDERVRLALAHLPEQMHADMSMAATMYGRALDKFDPWIIEHAQNLADRHGIDGGAALDRAVNDFEARNAEQALADTGDHAYEGIDDDRAEHSPHRSEGAAPADDRGGRASAGGAEGAGSTRGGPAGGASEGAAASLTLPPVVDHAAMARYDEPTGEGVKALGDSVWHDLAAEFGEKPDPAIAARDAAKAKLGAEAPLRGENKTGQAQDGTMGLGLFDASDTRTFDLGDGKGPRTVASIAAELDSDQQAVDTIKDCL